jgi:hypothetical protein
MNIAAHTLPERYWMIPMMALGTIVDCCTGISDLPPQLQFPIDALVSQRTLDFHEQELDML